MYKECVCASIVKNKKQKSHSNSQVSNHLDLLKSALYKFKIVRQVQIIVRYLSQSQVQRYDLSFARKAQTKI